MKICYVLVVNMKSEATDNANDLLIMQEVILSYTAFVDMIHFPNLHCNLQDLMNYGKVVFRALIVQKILTQGLKFFWVLKINECLIH